MNILLIIHQSDAQERDKLNARIEAYSDSSYFISDNIVIVKTTFSTKDLYEKITEEDFETTQILIVFFSNEYLGFWGRMNAQLWRWLEQNQDNDPLSNSLVDEIASLKAQLDELQAENKKLKEKISYSQIKGGRKMK